MGLSKSNGHYLIIEKSSFEQLMLIIYNDNTEVGTKLHAIGSLQTKN